MLPIYGVIRGHNGKGAVLETNVKAIELKDLWRKYKASGSDRAREQLVVAYSPLVKYVAGRMSSGLPAHVEEADLISYGLLGLISAIERFEPERENFGGSAWPSDWDEVLLRHPHSNVRIGLLRHPTNSGEPFSEVRTGLDHIEFEVTSLDELAAWRGRLERAGVAHSGAHDHIVTFRDPDNIQLELYCEPQR